MINRVQLVVLLAVLFSGNVFSQNKIGSDFQHKYHVIDMSELSQLGFNQKDFLPTPAPSGFVQSIAEFEKMQGVVIAVRNNFGVPLSLISEIALDDTLYVLVEDQSGQNDVNTDFIANGVNLDKVVYIQTQLNSYWTRDYAPWFIREDSAISIIDFPYNRPRPKDDAVPVVMAGFLGTNYYGMNMLHTGGNYMTDGMGKGISTDLVSDENTTMSASDIATMAEQYLGLNDYELATDPLGEYIKHIDCWGKFLDVDKILIGQVPITDTRYADFEALADYYANKPSSYGTNYEVYRTYSPNDQPYTNSLILNRKVFVPFVDGNGSQWNDTAKAVYEEAMPGYEVIGIPETQYISWYNTDALHCRTHGIADLGMLYIRHTPLHDTLAYDPLGIQIFAHIKAYSDSSLISDSLLVYYKKPNSSYQTVSLSLDSANSYSGNIPVNYGDTVWYYIAASDNSGRRATHPFIGPADAHQFFVEQLVQSNSTLAKTEEFKLFPNPTNGIFYLKTTLSKLEIFDLQGRLLFADDLNGNPYQRYDFSNWEKGVYLVRASGNAHVETVRLVIQ